MFEIRKTVYTLASGAIVFWRYRDSEWCIKQFDDVIALDDLSPENQRVVFESLRVDVREEILNDYHRKEPKPASTSDHRVDCGVPRWSYIDPRKVKYQELIGRTVLCDDKTWTILTEDNLAEYAKRESIVVRTAFTCALPEGVCSVCAQYVSAGLGLNTSPIRRVAPTLIRFGEMEVDAINTKPE